MCFKRYALYSLGLFIVTCLLLVIIVPLDDTYKLFAWWQVFSFVVWSLFFCVSNRLDSKGMFVLIGIYQLMMSLVLHFYFRNNFSDIWGPGSVDALLYAKMAMIVKDLSLTETIRVIGFYVKDLSDYAFPLFLKYIYWLGGNLLTSNFILVCMNCFFQRLTAIITYKLSYALTNDKHKTNIITLLWAFNTASIYVNVAGLKEPLFLLLCMSAMWGVCKIKRTQHVCWHLFTWALIASLWFFRYYVSLFFIIIYVGYILFPKVWNKYFALICLSAIVLCIYGANLLVQFFPEIYYANMYVDGIYAASGTLFRCVSYVLTFLGPIPKLFDVADGNVLFMIVYTFVKFFFSIFAILGSWMMVRKKETQYYPLIAICLFQILLLIVSGHIMDYRFTYVTMPCFFILMIEGMKYQFKWATRLYPLFAVMVVVLFNLGAY